MSGGKEKIFDGNGEETDRWGKSEGKNKSIKVVWVGCVYIMYGNLLNKNFNCVKTQQIFTKFSQQMRCQIFHMTK